MTPQFRAKVEELLRKRFFYAPAFSIYGGTKDLIEIYKYCAGVAGLYDIGPPGCALQANILTLWRQHFVLEENMLELDATILTPYDVLKSSGHVDRFTDYMVRDAKTGDFYRADHLVEAALETRLADPATSAEDRGEYQNILAQIDGYGETALQAFIDRFGLLSDAGNPLTPVTKFNLMFPSEIGPSGNLKAFMRPETAQGQFVNFRRLLECNNDRMPFASAMIGKSFRNEISPRSGLLRVREFTMAEVEHYVHPEHKDHARFEEVSQTVLNWLPRSVQESGSTVPLRMSVGEAVAGGMVNNQTLGYFLARTALFLWAIGIKADRLRFRQHLANEMAHYASDCWDAEIQSSYGWVECVGCADRAAFDLSMHSQSTGERLVARERLATPERVEVRRLEINRKEIGVAFRKDAKSIVEHLESLSLGDAETLLQKSEEITIEHPSLGPVKLKTPEMVRMVETTETVHVREYIPCVIEPSFGIGRIMYSLLEHAYWTRDGDENRAVLSLPAAVAPTKVLVVPLSHHEAFKQLIREVMQLLRRRNIAAQIDDSSASIGKRYARNDEVGIPFGITIDFQSVRDQTVTIRERDSTQQIRVPVTVVAGLIEDLVAGHATWTTLTTDYPLFTEQKLDDA